MERLQKAIKDKVTKMTEEVEVLYNEAIEGNTPPKKYRNYRKPKRRHLPQPKGIPMDPQFHLWGV